VALGAGLVAATAVVPVGPAGSARAADAVVLRVGTTEKLDSTNPWLTYLPVGFEVFQLTYDLLTEFDSDGEPAPGFAEAWNRTPDRVTFHIRSGMKWSDGEPATSADACYSWQLDLDAIAAAPLVWTTGTALSREPSRSATLAALDAATFAVHDLDDRPMLWPAGEAHTPWAREAVSRAQVVVGNQAEAAVAVGEGSPREQAERLLEMGPRTVIVKQGPRGVLGATADGEVVEVAPVPVEVVCGLGAGDAFGGALCHSLLSGWGLEQSMRFCNAAGAIVASRLACSDAMPTQAEVEALLEGAVRA
jgi:hypothetical protein